MRSIALRPKLVIAYEDGSQALSSTVAVSQPAPSELVKGTISVKAGALDDGAVSQVEFFLDGSISLGTDTSAPFEVSWNTTSASRGSHTLTAKATDEAGNETTSQGVTVTVANGASPTSTVTSAAPQGGGSSNIPPTANASADPTSGSPPLTVDFTGSGSDPDGSIADYAWDLDGDGAYDDSTAQSPSFQYTADGLYYARLRVSDDQGAYGFSTPVTISVGAPPSAPTVVGTPTTGSGNNPTSGSWTLASGWQPGDLAIVWWYARGGVKTITEGSTITQTVDSIAGDNHHGRLFVGYRYLQSGDSNPTWTASSSSNATTVWGAIVLRGGPGSGDPFEAASNVLGALGVQSPNPPAVTTLTDDALVLTLVGKNNDSASSTPPAGYTSRGFVSSTAGNDGAGGAASIVRATAGSEDPGAWTLDGTSSDNSLTWTAAVAPGGGGGGNQLPTAVASANPTNGTAPLTVTFNGASSSDPDGSITAYAWDLDGDGLFDDSTAANPSYQYTQPGTYVARLRVTDDGGAYGFSAPLTIAVSSPGSQSTLWDVTASASDDIGVTTVEFYADGDRFATDSSSPYAATLDTLAYPVYDGSHNLTVKAYDADGNVTTSANYPITVANTAGTKYQATIATSNVPLELSYDPEAGTQEGAPLTVSLTNSSTCCTWLDAEIKLRYRWFTADAPPVTSESANLSIGGNLSHGGQRNVAITVDPPALPTGVYRARYKLRIDLYDTAASSYFAAKGNAPYETWVTVTRELADELGLERYQQYSGEDLGGGFDHALNLGNGNSVVQWVPFSQPGRGLNSVVTMTYNALEHGSVSPLGNNWSLAISSLMPFGLPLDVHPNAADTAAGRTDKWVGFTDGDGSYHVFTGNGAGSYYAAPPGVHLYLKEVAGGWELWKPDRTKFVFDSAGFPTSVEDSNGNALTFTLATPAAGEDAYGLAKRVTAVTDAGGRDFTVAYFTKAETPVPALRGKVKRITDHVGHALEFSYYEDGNLRSIRELGGPGDDGMPTPDREVVFAYTTPDGTGPAIGSFQDRQHPDPETVQSPKLYSLIDFRGNETSFEYSTAADAKKWRVTARTNRAGNETTFAYDSTARETTETMPLSRVWTYTFDTEGRVTEIEDPVNAQPTTIEWADATAPNEVTNSVRKVTQPSGEFVEYAYNANGYKTDEWDELRNRQTFEYENLAVDANDASGNWEAGRSIPHLSQLSALVKPRGNATTGNPDDYRWEFAYTGTGLVDTITDPLGNVIDNAWNANGTLVSQTLPANGDGITRTTTFNTYDANGFPTQVTDAAGGVAKAGYAANGNLLFEQDPNHGSYSGGTPSEYRTEHSYDAFGRLTRTSQPKSTGFAPRLLIWDGQAYDANDNEISSVAAHYGRGDGGNGALTTMAFDAMDRETLLTGPRGEAEGGAVQTKTDYDAAGRVTKVTEPKGVNSEPSGGAWEKDFLTETAYDLLDREQTVTAYAVDGSGNVDNTATRTRSYCYDDAGDLRSVTGPKGAASFTSCPDPAADPYVYTSATHTTKFVYDDAHRQVKQIDELGQETETGYDENGEVTAETDEADKVTETFYDDRGLTSKLVEPFDGTDTLTTIWEYDPLGNLKQLISPRAFDAAGGQAPYTDYVESYSYDALSRLVTTTLPAGPEPSYDVEVESDNPVGYWRMHSAPGSESNTGSAGSALDVSYTGTVTSVAGALAGDDGASFDGSSYATVSATPATYGVGASNVTLEAWVNVPDTSRKGAFVHVGNGANGYALGIGSTSFDNLGNHLIGLYESVRWINTGVNIGMGWHHVAMTISGGTATFFLDGAQVASSGGSGAIAPTGGFNVGGYSSATRRFAGTVDEAAVYASVLAGGRITAHFNARTPASTPQAYRHQAYDANGNTIWTSLATTAATPGAVTQSEKTTVSYWDTGSIYSSQDPTNPKVRFDYAAEGWQAARIPEIVGSEGSLDYAKSMYWEYFPDGLLSAHVDQERQRALYSYDANGNKTQALEATGIVSPGQTPLAIDLSYSSLDELEKVRTPKPGVSGTYQATLLGYDLHGNTAGLTDNREENGSGSQTSAGRVFTYSYNAIDQATSQVDDFSTGGTTDDEHIIYTYKSTGELDTQVLQKRPSGSWVDEQSSARTYYDNGLLKTLVNKNGSGTTIESHALSYVAGGVYLNGNRTSDVFLLKGPDASAPCYTTTCTASWTYDARERLLNENPGAGSPTSFTLDVQGNVTQEVSGTSTTTRTYAGQQLVTEDFSSGQDKRYLYDSLGSVDCVVKLAYVGASCPAAGSVDLLEDNIYDYKSRLAGFRAYNGSGALTKTADYTTDPLDRPISQDEWVSPSTTTSTAFTYVGVTNAVSKETLSNATNTTKKYSYDVFGQRTTITEGATPNRYSYLYDPHGSVSLLIDQSNNVKESYGYAAYGASNAALTKSVSGFNNQSVPKNPYRYTGKRLDSGSGTYDMGARRYSASTGRFLQYDLFYSALANLGLSTDPLTQNRYALAGANPITFVEVDGHFAAPFVTGEGGANLRNLFDATCRGTGDFYGSCTSYEGTKYLPGGGIEGSGGLAALAKILYEASGAKDAVDCVKEPSASTCAWAALAVTPFGKLVKGAKLGAKTVGAIHAAGAAKRGTVYVTGSRRTAEREFHKLVAAALPGARIEKKAPGVWIATNGDQTIRLRAPVRNKSVRTGRSDPGSMSITLEGFGLRSKGKDVVKIIYQPKGKK